jgi:outer membrane biosynthesis protein TonB
MNTRIVSRLALFLLALALFDANEIRAFPDKNTSQQSGGSAPPTKAQGGIELLTDTEGLDFKPTLRELYRSVKEKWLSNMPPSVQLGNQGVNSIVFRVLRDGSIPKEFVKMAYRSGKDDFDAASLQSVREAGPVSHLPEKFSQPFILLRFTFYYNISPPKP